MNRVEESQSQEEVSLFLTSEKAVRALFRGVNCAGKGARRFLLSLNGSKTLAFRRHLEDFRVPA